MAIGDAVAVQLGSAATNRQPSSGVEEQITAIVKPAGTDQAMVTDGSDTREIFRTTVKTDVVFEDGGATRRQPYNMAIMITNAIYVRKNGTSDRIYFGGIQTAV